MRVQIEDYLDLKLNTSTELIITLKCQTNLNKIGSSLSIIQYVLCTLSYNLCKIKSYSKFLYGELYSYLLPGLSHRSREKFSSQTLMLLHALGSANTRLLQM